MSILSRLKQNPYADENALRYYAHHKSELSKFAADITKRLGDSLIGILITPVDKSKSNNKPTSKKSRENPTKKQFNTLVLTSDIAEGDVRNLAKQRKEIIDAAFARRKLPNETLEVIHISALWQACQDGTINPEKIVRFEKAACVTPSRFLSTFILTLHHKARILAKFEEYVMCYCLSGSTVRGSRKDSSDLDVFCVVNDTDLKKMTLAELKVKLREIILSMGRELAEEFQVPLDVNAQVYVLTDFWDALRDGNPIICTLLRDAVPLHDRGLVAPWKNMLKAGRIRPSIETEENWINAADQAFEDASKYLSQIGQEQLYYALLNYAQAILSSKGLPPLTPHETLKAFAAKFLRPPYAFSKKAFKTLSHVAQLRKKLEHEERRRLSPAEVALLYKYVKRDRQRFKVLYRKVRREARYIRLKELRAFLKAKLEESTRVLAIALKGELSPKELTTFLSKLPISGYSLEKSSPRFSHLISSLNLKISPDENTLRDLEIRCMKAVKALDSIVDVLASSNPTVVTPNGHPHKWIVSFGRHAILTMPITTSETEFLSYERKDNGKLKTAKHVDVREILLRGDLYRTEQLSPSERANQIDAVRANLSLIVAGV